MTTISRQEWRKKVQKKLGKIPDVVWKRVIERGYIDTANEEENMEKGAGLSYLIEVIGPLLDDYEAFSSSPRLPTPKPDKDLPLVEIEPDRRFKALTDIIATLSNRDEDVRNFRDEVLGGKLLSPEEVPKWIETQKAKESHTVTVSIDVTAGDGWEDRFLEKAKQVVERRRSGKQDWLLCIGSICTHTLDYTVPGQEWIRRVVINKDGPLGRLKRLAESFKDFWPETLAVHFILTGEAYPVSRGRITKRLTNRASKIMLELSPYFTGTEIKELYLKERKELLKVAMGKTKVRELKDRHIELAVFGVKELGSWTKKMQKWNVKYPQWKYSNKSTFARDVRAAYKRITGWSWK